MQQQVQASHLDLIWHSNNTLSDLNFIKRKKLVEYLQNKAYTK